MDTTMNNRIDEIILEHGLHKAECYSRMKMLAELIVRECAMAAIQTPCPYENEEIKRTYGHTWTMACVESGKEIERHFGIEK